jgi:protein-S-isoprenylcysteine O-methyltransferase Ste14
VDPSKPAIVLVTEGIFRWSRNPIYVGGSIMVAGIALAFALDWVMLLFVASLPLLHFGIIAREERYLEKRFGDAYRQYKTNVPRYARLS